MPVGSIHIGLVALRQSGFRVLNYALGWGSLVKASGVKGYGGQGFKAKVVKGLSV